MKKTLAILALLVSAPISFGELSATYAPVSYNCNGSATAYAFPHTFFEKTDLNVYVVTSNGVSTLLEEGAGAGKYTVYAANSDYSSGATITAGTAYSTGTRIVISRAIPYGQGLVINGDFVPSKPLEQALDKLAGQIQQVKDGVGRTITIPVTDPAGLNMELPPAESRAGKIAYFTTNGALSTIPFIDSGIVYGDGTTIDISNANVISVKDAGISSTKLASSVNARINASLTNIAAGSITFGMLADVRTNITVDSQTNLVTAGAVKEYMDNYALRFLTNAGTILFEESGFSTNWTQLDLSPYVGTNRAIVYFNGVSGAANANLTFSRSPSSYTSWATNTTYVGNNHMFIPTSNKIGECSTMTTSSGTVWYISSNTSTGYIALIGFQKMLDY